MDPRDGLQGRAADRRVGTDRHRERVDDDVLDGNAIFLRGDPHDLVGQLDPLVGLHRDLVGVIGEGDDGSVVLLDQGEDGLHPLVLGGDRVDERTTLVDREPGLQRLHDGGVDADREVGEGLDEFDRLDEQLGLVGQGHPHVDVEDIGTTGHLGGDVLLDEGEISGAQGLLEDLAPRRIDPFADDAEGSVGGDDHLLGRTAQDRAAGLTVPAHALTFARRSLRSALAFLTVALASAA